MLLRKLRHHKLGIGRGLNVAYEAFSLGAKYNDAKCSEVCSKSYESYNIKGTDYSSAKVLFAQALPTIDKCLKTEGCAEECDLAKLKFRSLRTLARWHIYDINH
jgi:hypothetical protein